MTADTPTLGQAFNDVLAELHQHVFRGVPGESDPFVLSLLEREYLAYVLALYYQCTHCQEYHKRMIVSERTRARAPDWDWEDNLGRLTLFLIIEYARVDPTLWGIWEEVWCTFAKRINARHQNLAHFAGYAIGIARNDAILMKREFDAMSRLYTDTDTMYSVLRDIDRVVIFMKAATSKNRTDRHILEHLASFRTAHGEGITNS